MLLSVNTTGQSLMRASDLKKLVPLRLKLYAATGLSGLRRLIVGPKTKALLVEAESGLLLVGVEDMQVGRKLSANGAYATAEIDRLTGLINEQSDILILGGHIGTVVIPLARAARSVTVLEPNPDSFQLLELNLKLNSCSNVKAFNLAAGDKAGQLSFLASRANSGGSKRAPVTADYRYLYDHPDTITVSAVAVDDLFPDISFDLIVMDIEGSEYFALKGMPKLLVRARTLAVEFLPHHLKNVAGVSPAQFVDQVYPFFDRLYIPSKDSTVDRSRFHSVLDEMFNHDEIDEGLIFSKK